MNNDRILSNVRRVIKEMMSAGTGGFTASAPTEGPVAGYDKVMKKPKKLKKVKDLRDG